MDVHHFIVPTPLGDEIIEIQHSITADEFKQLIGQGYYRHLITQKEKQILGHNPDGTPLPPHVAAEQQMALVNMRIASPDWKAGMPHRRAIALVLVTAVKRGVIVLSDEQLKKARSYLKSMKRTIDEQHFPEQVLMTVLLPPRVILPTDGDGKDNVPIHNPYRMMLMDFINYSLEWKPGDKELMYGRQSNSDSSTT